ncbi:MAG: hypothetical protein K8J31_07125 [Anaerolineae bacterium]|nr:hypothetical protein [Anaerolineae bacterium]
MASERIGDMTRAEFEDWVQQLIDRRLKSWPSNQPDDRPPYEVFESMRRHLLKRKPGQPSVLEMIREDRDR